MVKCVHKLIIFKFVLCSKSYYSLKEFEILMAHLGNFLLEHIIYYGATKIYLVKPKLNK